MQKELKNLFLSLLKVKDVFYQYFSDGYTPAEAASYHKSTILEEMSSESLSDSKVCPTERQISYLFNIWKEENLGTSIDPFQKLMDKSKIYENAGKKI